MNPTVYGRTGRSDPFVVRAARRIHALALRNRVGYEVLWRRGYSAIRQTKTTEVRENRPEAVPGIVAKLKEHGVGVVDYEIDRADFRRWVEKARYGRFPGYYGGGTGRNFVEKALEHYLAAVLLGLTADDVYIDVASADSPAPDIYREMYGCAVYRQGLEYPDGIHGEVIGGDAADLPLRSGFATKMALHCSFEHFEQDSDMRFIRETSRVLQRGGKLCIVPLYLSARYTVMTDPAMLPWKRTMLFEPDATVWCVRGYFVRHGRLYDVPHFVARVRDNLRGLGLTTYVVHNEKEIDSSCYVKFAAVFEKAASE